MKRTKASDGRSSTDDELLPEYDLDYRNTRPNRFAGRSNGRRLVVTLDPDVSEVFTTAESVNAVLRALIGTMPSTGKKVQARRGTRG
jgi:hypothetical protein